MNAIFGGPNNEYRYLLTRELNLTINKTLTFIMLNPSTANEIDNDPTITRCIKYACKWGFDRLFVVNLYAYRATDPRELAMLKLFPPVGPKNDSFINYAFVNSEQIVAAWGGNLLKDGPDRVKRIIELAARARKQIFCLKVNQDGNPAHPLYLKGDLKPIIWEGVHEF
jgi:hypothetical protein